jgi:hypothetical protein
VVALKEMDETIGALPGLGGTRLLTDAALTAAARLRIPLGV